MSNKAIDSFDQFEEYRKNGMLERRLEHFQKKYMPKDPELASEFFAEFTMLVRSMYDEASKPYTKALTAALSLVPFPTQIIKKEGE